ncbi:unnamed protein product [Linum tenue]|uniref:Uncharacterized protein n=1 Tax=Linum tenue TaxID=586396 RepID=A0AAV0NFM1_9ROSI|nr:unnamed protein product [Linum tenue]
MTSVGEVVQCIPLEAPVAVSDSQPIDADSKSYDVTTRPNESVTASNPSFVDGVATKDIHIDPITSLSIRIFLSEFALNPPDPDSKLHSKGKPTNSNKPGAPRRSDIDQHDNNINVMNGRSS